MATQELSSAEQHIVLEVVGGLYEQLDSEQIFQDSPRAATYSHRIAIGPSQGRLAIKNAAADLREMVCGEVVDDK